MNFENDEAFKKFINRLARVGSRSQKTKITYCMALKNFVNYTGLQPCEIIEGVKTGTLNPYSMLDDFVGYLIHEKRAPKTVNVYVAGIKKFFEANGVYLQRERLKAEVELPKAEALTHDKMPTEDELKLVFNLLNLRGRALLAVMVSSGMRIGEVIKIKLSDVHFDKPLTWISLRREYTKGKKPRIVFISDEASALLQQYIETEKARGRFKSKEERIFNISQCTAWYILMHAFRRANILEKGEYGRYILHPHSLRKYFKTMMASAGVQESFIDLLMGHRKYLDESYLRANKEMLAKEYLKAMPKLTISSPTKKESKFDKLLEMAKLLGISEEELREFVTSHLFHGQEFILDKGRVGENGIDVLELAYAIFPKEVEALFKQLVKRKASIPNSNDNCQKIVSEEDLEQYLAKGYKVKTVLPSGRIIVGY